MPDKEVIKSSCTICYTGCGVLVHKEGGKVVKVVGDPDSKVNKGILCTKGLHSADLLYHPDRLTHPLKRVGEKGEGKWQRISWDEALDTIAAEFSKAKENHGAESVAFLVGSMKGMKDTYLHRLASLFGTPNQAYSGHICWMPGIHAWNVTCGFFPLPDLENGPACILNWGVDNAATLVYMHSQIVAARKKGARIILVDPRKAKLAAQADLWLRLRPGTDLALALGMVNVIIEEDLYDKEFVEEWTIGFDDLRNHVRDYTPKRVEEITWVPAEQLKEAARIFATSKPATVGIWGNALDMTLNSFGAGRAIATLASITGNLDVPGGDCPRTPSGVNGRLRPQNRMLDSLSPEQKERRTDRDLGLIPLQKQVTPESVNKAILEEKPFPVKVLYLQATNPLITSPNSREVYEAFKKVDFLVATELFMTPSAEMADIVLPVGSYLEVDEIVEGGRSSAVAVQRKVEQIGECRSDYQILRGLAQRLGFGEHFPEEQQMLDNILEPIGMTFEEFKDVGSYQAKKNYRAYEKNGFATPSGKVELYSDRLKEWGYDPMPVYRDLPERPESDPGLAKEYPLIFTNRKHQNYLHSQGRQIEPLRRKHEDPVTEIHSETADRLGIKDGDWVYIETKRGRIRQKAALTDDLDPRVVIVDFGWWYPEKGPENIHGWDEANINILTSSDGPLNQEMGSCNMRGLACRVYKT